MLLAVAVVGAAATRSKFGNKAVRAFDAQGWRVYPIHPRAATIEGHQAYRTVVDVPGALDMATVYVPPGVGVTLLEGFARKGIPEIWINPGAESEALLAEAARLGLHVITACSIIGIGELPGRY
jgi:predicted CoA-binding protein